MGVIIPRHQPPEPPIDRTTHRVVEGQYIAEARKPTGIMLHHTVSGAVKGVLKWWNATPERIGTAYLVERDGTIYEVFPPECWAYHLGLPGKEFDKRTIGIELVSEGALHAEQDPRNPARFVLVAFHGTAHPKVLGYADDLYAAGRVVYFPDGYRGYQWFDAYDAPQWSAACQLVAWLCERYTIPARFPREALEPDGDWRRWFGYAGVLHHAMVRKDKSDLYPGEHFTALGRALRDPAWAGGGL